MSLPGLSAVLNPRRANAWWRRVVEFFAYHGVWAFGVRVMRLWSLRTKMALLVTVMALPLAWLMVQQIRAHNAGVQVYERRLAGLRVAQAWQALATQFVQHARTFDEGKPVDDSAAAQALTALGVAVAAAADDGMGPLAAAWRAHQPALTAVVSDGANSPAARRAARGAARMPMAAVYTAALDSSQLLVDADPAADARLSAAFDQLPTVRRELSRVRSTLVRQIALQEQSPRPLADLHALTLTAAVAVADLDRIAGLMVRTSARFKGAARSESEEVIGQLRAVVSHARTSLLALEPAADLPVLHAELSALLPTVDLLQAHLATEAESHLLAKLAEAKAGQRWLALLLLFTTVLASYLVYSFFLVMRGGLAQLSQQMHRMAKGDLSARPQARGGDEVADTMQAMTLSLARLSDLLASVRQGVGSITQASMQIAGGNADLSSRSRRAGQGLDQLVLGVTRYSEQLQACSRMVESVVTTVQALRLASVRNRKQMQRLQDRMGSLRGKSREIGEIVNLIDTIAFRTNILALNASVEASKAGDAGRGFAVVAQEVRALATRSADSARRISEIVAGSTLEIEQSGALADETGQSIQAADVHADAIHAAMSGVAELTHQGDRESAAILDEVRLLQDSTAQNLGLVEQLAVASDALRGQGERLSLKVGLFKLS
jgi:methyl-accepting chemotaxis protein